MTKEELEQKLAGLHAKYEDENAYQDELKSISDSFQEKIAKIDEMEQSYQDLKHQYDLVREAKIREFFESEGDEKDPGMDKPNDEELEYENLF